MQIHESAEDYLEAILMIQLEKGHVRSIDVARKLNYSKPSVSRAVNLLQDNGYLVMARDGMLELTESGRRIAETIYERHVLLTQWLVSLGVPDDIASEDACKLEHDVSPATFERLKDHIVHQHLASGA
jgi:Mn-dependent DtxR family transcriptional regulator